MSTLTIVITGMTCGGCVNSVSNVLRGTDGVREVSVSLLPSQARVDYDEARVKPEQLAQAVRDAGFGVADLGS